MTTSIPLRIAPVAFSCLKHSYYSKGKLFVQAFFTGEQKVVKSSVQSAKAIAQGSGICYNLFAFGDMKNLTFFVYVEVTYDIAAFAYYMLCPLLENPHAAC